MASQATLQDIADAIDPAMLHKPSAKLREFLTSIPESTRVSERRQAERYSLIADVIVVPLDEELHPAAHPFVACSRNVSTGGMCLYHAAPVESTLIYVEIGRPNTRRVCAVMKVLRQQRVGSYFEIAGELVPPTIAIDASDAFTAESKSPDTLS